MAIEWSGLGPELLVRLDRSAPEPLRAQLEASLREAIRDGRLRGGERLPSSRELARGLGVSRGMVQECYGQLLAEGYLTSGGGSATRVADIRERPERAAHPVPGSPVPRPGSGLIADFQPGLPDLSSFPRSDWAKAVRQACTEIATADLGYGDPHGSAGLREVLAAYLRRVRAAHAVPGQMVVTTGFAQGINLVLRALRREHGLAAVAFEDPGYGSAEDDETVRAALAIGLRVEYVPVDDDGLVVSALAASGAQAVVVTPAHQSPTGVVLSAARRHALVDWAQQTGGHVIEDDYDSEFRYDSDPVGALQGLAPDQVFLLGTASKALAPAVRLGWVHAPAALAGAVAADKEMSDRGSCTVDQLALAILLTSGRYDRHLRRMRSVYAARRAALVEAFDQHRPGVRLTGLAAGFQAIVPLPAGADEAAVITAARDRRVGLYGLSGYRGRADPAAVPALVMGVGNVGPRAIDPALAARAVADLLG